MNDRLFFAVSLGGLWGILWAICLQWTDWGRWLAVRRTWITVVIGVGVDGFICLLVLPFDLWLQAAAVVVASSLAIIARSLINELRDDIGD